MVDVALQETIAHRFPRLMAAGVDYNDAQTVLSTITRMEEWMPVWEGLAEGHEALGDVALAEERTLTAGEAFVRAALYFHIGQSVSFGNAEEKARVQRRQRAAYAKAAPHLIPPAKVIDIPFDADSFPANLRVPDTDGPAPCVLITCGGDSTKEEFHTLENEFLRRGIATCAYDGPGQSLTQLKWRIRPDWEVPVGAVLDALETRPEIDRGRMGIWGRSFGGYAAPRAAADPRIKACVSIGGFHSMAGFWNDMPFAVQDTLRFAFGDDTVEEAAETAKLYTLNGVLGRIGCPLLIVHSELDEICPVEESQRMIDEAGDDAELVVFQEGNHVCDNIPFKSRPLMADWMAAKLGV
ncbi:MAG: alpha/beta hydrolase [Rhodospirillaceae bacterium]|nr:alpha/beta hydrolase [Rhodospirillaceae bacterium]